MGGGASKGPKKVKKTEIERYISMGRTSVLRSQKKASDGLERISRTGQEASIAIVELGGVQVVTSVLAASKSSTVRLKSAMILNNVSQYETVRRQLYDERACLTLVELLAKGKPAALRPQCISAIGAMALLPDARPELVPAVGDIITFIAEGDLSAQLTGLSALQRISAHRRCHYKMARDGAIGACEKILLSQFHTVEHKAFAIQTIAELCNAPVCHPLVLACNKGAGLQFLVAQCKNPAPPICSAAAAAVERLAAADEESALELVDYGILKAMRHMLERDADAVASLAALRAIAALALQPDIQRVIVEDGLLPLVLSHSNSPEEPIRAATAVAISHISENPLNRPRVIYNGGHETLLYHAKYAADSAVKSTAAAAAGSLLNLPGAKRDQLVRKAASVFRSATDGMGDGAGSSRGQGADGPLIPLGDGSEPSSDDGGEDDDEPTPTRSKRR